MKKTIMVLACVFLLAGCNNVKLTNGENALVTFEEGGISSDDLYNVLKETYGAENITNLIDKYLLEKLYKSDNEEKSYIKQSLETAKSSAKEMNADFDTYVYYYYNVSGESAFKDYISLNYKRSLWIEDYAQEIVSDKQIEEYYKDEVVGDMEASHILITSKAKDNATDEEKSSAEKEAYQKAKDIIDKLKSGEDFSKLAKQYSEDEETATKGGSLGKINDGDYADEVIESLKSLKVGSYTLTPVKSSYGYHIIYKSSQGDKAKLDDTLKKEIRATIGKEIADQDGFYIKAMKALREKNKMKILDSDLEKAYEKLVARYEAQSNTSK